MRKTQYLLLKLGEECAEVAQRCSKQIQFGKSEAQKGQGLTNGERLKNELLDLMAVTTLLQMEMEIPTWTNEDLMVAVIQKRDKMQKYLDLSASLNELPPIKL